MRPVRITLAILAGVVLFSILFRDLPAEWLAIEDPLATVDAIVVMAGDPDYERTKSAARLMRLQRARWLVLTGGERGPGDSAASLRDQALALGVPADAIRTESLSHSTREAVVAVEPILRAEQVRSVMLVTSPYHQRRTYYCARRAWPGIILVNRPAQPSSWLPQGWWRRKASRDVVFKEYVKLAYYALRGWLS
ncbi:MAG: YdcF family protein [Vicinamibacteria bacterium]|nr:YdcF family protein [Vicinamibacteria bacterium]